MKIKFWQAWANYDWVLQTAVLLLLLIGLISHYVSSLNEAGELSSQIFAKQLISVGLGLFLLILISLIDFRWYRSWSKLLYLASVILLFLVLILGHTIRGTRGWFVWGEFSFQPVEIVKILLVICLAAYLVYVGAPLNFKKTIGSFFILLLPLALVLYQPDFGSASLLVISWLVMLAMVPKKLTWWLTIGSLVIITLLMGWFSLKDYQRARIEVFLNPRLDPLGQGYNVTQSIIAVGAGGLTGRGLGLGTQSRLDFLPEQQTDFIFASITEELGLIGSSLILFLYFIIFLRLVRLIRRLRDDFSLLVVGGFGSLLLVQVVLNISMNIGLAPVVGLPLPFLSTGGSSLVASLIVIGMIQNLSRHYGRQAPYEQQR